MDQKKLCTDKYQFRQVVQVYISWDPSNTIAPLRQLAAFRRLFIKNGETVSVQLTVYGDQMAVWVDDGIRWNVLPGEPTI